MTRPDVSLVVPTYRGAARLPALLEAFSRQDHPGEWEAVIVIDGVVDDSEAVVAAAIDVPVRTVVLPENQGRSAALNAGFAAARGEVLVRCDDDLEPRPDFVRTHHEAHQATTPRGVIGLVHNVFPEGSYGSSYGADFDVRFREVAYSVPASDRWRYWAANCSVPRALYDEVGDYDTRFRTYGWEDIDWGFRLAQTGAEIDIVRNLETVHHAANVNARVRVTRSFHAGRSRARFDRKHDLPPPPREQGSGVAQTSWNGLVRATSHLGSEQRFVAIAGGLDRIIERLPTGLSVKAVALLVESSAIAGYRSRAGVDTTSV